MSNQLENLETVVERNIRRLCGSRPVSKRMHHYISQDLKSILNEAKKIGDLFLITTAQKVLDKWPSGVTPLRSSRKRKEFRKLLIEVRDILQAMNTNNETEKESKVENKNFQEVKDFFEEMAQALAVEANEKVEKAVEQCSPKVSNADLGLYYKCCNLLKDTQDLIETLKGPMQYSFLNLLNSKDEIEEFLGEVNKFLAGLIPENDGEKEVLEDAVKLHNSLATHFLNILQVIEEGGGTIEFSDFRCGVLSLKDYLNLIADLMNGKISGKCDCCSGEEEEEECLSRDRLKDIVREVIEEVLAEKVK